MTHDERRNAAYRVALEQHAAGRVVLDIGTGRDAVLARLAVACGARHVYAIELLASAYQAAQRTLTRLGLTERITLIQGDVRQVTLPEPVDVCVSELVGALGGSEGAGRLLTDARRFFAAPAAGVMIPARAVTRLAAATLPEPLRSHPRFSVAAGYYVDAIVAQRGARADLRVCLKHFPLSCVRSDSGVFEALDFTQPVPDTAVEPIALTIQESGVIDGFVVWLTLTTTPGAVLDVLHDAHSWLPVFVPAFYPGLAVTAGDRIAATCTRTPGANGLNPDYHLAGHVLGATGARRPFACALPHVPTTYQGSPFYQTLWATDERLAPGAAAARLAPAWRAALQARLPAYMVPATFVRLDALPQTSSGKIDRRALPALAPAPGASPGAPPPRTAVERTLARIWEQVLRRTPIGIHDDFFALGGHSLLGAQVLAHVQEVFEIELSLRVLFEAGTVAGMALALEREEPEPGYAQRAATLFEQVKEMPEEELQRALAAAGGEQ